MDVGAIVIVEAHSRIDESPSQPGAADLNSATFPAEGTLALLDLLGRSVLERTIDGLQGAHVKLTSLVVHSDLAACVPVFPHRPGDLTIRVADDPWPAVAHILESYWQNGCDCAFVAKPTAYTDADFADLVDFHRQGQRAVTRASDREGPLDLWVVSCNPSEETDRISLHVAGRLTDFLPAPYFVKEYVRRISHAQDFRRLVSDAFQRRCHLHPTGEQIRPGVWADQGVEIRRGARIVAPAYLGARCTIGERAVITRMSNIEHDCYIDYGTVIENSSVLPNTYVGIWLDVRRSVVYGNKLLNLEREVLVEVADPRLLRSNAAAPQAKRKAVPVPRPAFEKPLPKATVVDRLRSVNARTEFES